MLFVRVTFVGADIDSLRFEAAWPKARFRHGSCGHFVGECFRLHAVDDAQPDKFKPSRCFGRCEPATVCSTRNLTLESLFRRYCCRA